MNHDTSPRDFDAEARIWDEKPLRIKLAAEIAAAIRAEVSLTRDMDVLDFGCGTGLVTLALRPSVGSITGADSSRGMLEVLGAKIKRSGLENVLLHHLDPDDPALPPGPFQLIVSAMTFHHVQDPGQVLSRMYAVCAPGGLLAIADLEPEQGLFHSDNQGVFHFGFDRESLGKMFEGAGFTDVRVRPCTEVVKPAADGGPDRSFGVFLAVCEKKMA
jgi:2-polyprenyl-3-methyl-5-hydroxy-6-metoxy-1,4-benzoquinol methylase